LMLRPSGFMNSSRRISPGGIGSRCLVPMSVSVIVDEFHIRCIGIIPPKADAPLIVDADTVLALPGSAQRLEPIAGRDHQVLDGPRAMQVQQLSARRSFDRAKTGDKLVIESRAVSPFLKERITCAGYYAKRNTS